MQMERMLTGLKTRTLLLVKNPLLPVPINLQPNLLPAAGRLY